MKSKFVSLLLTVITCIALIGCSIPNNTIDTSPTEESITVTVAQSSVSELDLATESTVTTLSTKITTTTAATTSSTTKVVTTTTTSEIKAVAPSFSLSDVPPYSGSPYVEINSNTPFFTELPSDPFEIYSPLDNLGRCGVAYANISKELMPTEIRGEIGTIKPTGWHTANYSGIIEDIYLYNRCHLIGYQLAGENANERNLITGTRYMNVEGMEPFENKVANYVLSYNRHVLYRVTPIFEGNNLVANGVLMEAYSLEDNGAGVKFCVFCYNVQPNIGIDYATGDSWSLIEESSPPVVEPQQEVIDRGMPIVDDANTYVLNTNTHKFHYPSCSSVNSMKDKNKDYYTGSRDDVVAMGYEPCKRCNP